MALFVWAANQERYSMSQLKKAYNGERKLRGSSFGVKRRTKNAW